MLSASPTSRLDLLVPAKSYFDSVARYTRPTFASPTCPAFQCPFQQCLLVPRAFHRPYDALLGPRDKYVTREKNNKKRGLKVVTPKLYC